MLLNIDILKVINYSPWKNHGHTKPNTRTFLGYLFYKTEHLGYPLPIILATESQKIASCECGYGGTGTWIFKRLVYIFALPEISE